MSNDNNFLGGFNFDTSPFNQVLQNSLELMGQTWQNLSPNKTLPFAAPAMNLEELNKRIEELKHVESWLSMNLAMLKNTIQGLEIQRDSIVSFKELVQTVSDQHKNTPSLDEVLSNFGKQAQANPRHSGTSTESTAASNEEQATQAASSAAQAEAESATPPASTEALQQAGQAWWNLMHNQLETLLSAQAESLSKAEDAEGISDKTETPAKIKKVTPTQLKRSSKPAAKKIAVKKAAVAPETDLSQTDSNQTVNAATVKTAAVKTASVKTAAKKGARPSAQSSSRTRATASKTGTSRAKKTTATLANTKKSSEPRS